jgi:hypothetical protein
MLEIHIGDMTIGEKVEITVTSIVRIEEITDMTKNLTDIHILILEAIIIGIDQQGIIKPVLGNGVQGLIYLLMGLRIVQLHLMLPKVKM